MAVLTVGWFTLRPTPHGNRGSELPRDWSRWLNEHDALANFLAFLAFGFFAFFFTGNRGENPFKSRLLFGLLGFIVVIEAIQNFIPGRVFDWQDIAAGWCGIIVAASIFGLWYFARGRRTK